MRIRPTPFLGFLAVVTLAVLLTASSARGGTLIVHDAHHFQIEAPDGWYMWKDLNVSGDVVDLMIRGSQNTSMGPVGGVIVVTSEARAIAGSADEAAAILQEGIDNLSATVYGFRIVEPLARLTVGGNAAAKVGFWTQPSTYDVYQVLLVVTSAGWDRFWAISTGVFSWDLSALGPVVNASVSTFGVLPAPPSLDVGSPSLPGAWLFYGALAATAVEAGAIAFLILRQTRRPR